MVITVGGDVRDGGVVAIVGGMANVDDNLRKLITILTINIDQTSFYRQIMIGVVKIVSTR